MSCEANQCCAVSSQNSRCPNSAGEGKHCDFHRPMAVKLYLKYKKLSDQVDEMNLYKEFDDVEKQITHVRDCYVLLNKTYSARSAHRKYAFVPECYDAGHDHQFTKLKNLIDGCENILSKLYSQQANAILKKDSSSSSETPDSKPSKTPKSSRKKKNKRVVAANIDLARYIKKRKDIEADIEQWIGKYVRENRQILKERELLNTNIIAYILEMFNPDDPDDACEHGFSKCVMIFNLVHTLYSIGYPLVDGYGHVLDRYVTQRCQHCECQGYQAITLHLVCSCIYQVSSVGQYFNLSNEATLKQFYGLLLHNRAQILPLIDDIKSLYLVHRDRTMFLSLYLVWDSTKNRLIIEQNLNGRPVKHSKLLATTRLKNKYYEQRVAQIQPQFYDY